MNPPRSDAFRYALATLIAIIFLAILFLSGCGGSPTGPTNPTDAVTPPPTSSASAAGSSPRRFKPVTVSGPSLPAVLSLCPEITRATGLKCSYVGLTGGNLAFEVGSTAYSQIGTEFEASASSQYACALTYNVDNGNERVSSRHVFPSEAAMENRDPAWDCQRWQNTALHETGHGLGLPHPPSPCADQVLCGDGLPRTTAREFSAGDMAAFARLYR